LAEVWIFVRIKSPQFHWVAADCPATEALLNISFEGIISRYTDGEWGTRIRKRLCGPLHELGEVVEKRQLQPVLTVIIIRGANWREKGEKDDACRDTSESPSTPALTSPGASETPGV
jgi:hypothetical protein